jgi:1-deoxy-D-xylulose-5-phosphate reductoisomerase
MSGGVRVEGGAAALERVCVAEPFDILVVATGGTWSLGPTLAVADRVRRIAIANKELLVMAGQLLTERVRASGTALLPIDSEHSALFQCLAGATRGVRRLYLTGSGGPLRTVPKERFAEVTPEEAVNHPKWKMGKKITVDSATLMNKGLEIIEARWLFGVPVEQVEVLIHPEAIVHSMVEFLDGSVLAQLAVPDMRLPIQYALTYPERLPSPVASVDFPSLAKLTFEAPDPEKFPCLRLAYAVARQGGTAPCVFNAANEVAVAAFLERRIRLPEIPAVIEEVVARRRGGPGRTLEEILAADRWARETAEELVSQSAPVR